jgi:TonB-dependent SusC/RagA subfamily outer membrane receptor
VSNRSLLCRALVAIVIVPLPTLLACASKQTPDTSPAPNVNAGESAYGDGKSIESMFAGRFAGVTVTAAPGGGLMIRIRGGNNSFYGSEQPLYVVDDIPLPPGSGGIVFLNPHDIKKIEVLKNPADVAVYGMRGGNGVIKITTKRQLVR